VSDRKGWTSIRDAFLSIWTRGFCAWYPPGFDSRSSKKLPRFEEGIFWQESRWAQAGAGDCSWADVRRDAALAEEKGTRGENLAKIVLLYPTPPTPVPCMRHSSISRDMAPFILMLYPSLQTSVFFLPFFFFFCTIISFCYTFDETTLMISHNPNP
jgi:hypothetical protein